MLTIDEMEQVAIFLREHATTLSRDSDEFDLFGRSAFNRYYYSLFLVVREMLLNMNGDWKKCRHAHIPDILSSSVTREMNRALSVARRLDDNESIAILRQGTSSCKTLSTIFSQALHVREIADYFLEVKVERSQGAKFSLNSVPIGQLASWLSDVRMHRAKIERAWKLRDG
jgi:hypothetical protein